MCLQVCKYCVQCGYQIITDGQPVGFCSEECAEMFKQLQGD